MNVSIKIILILIISCFITVSFNGCSSKPPCVSCQGQNPEKNSLEAWRLLNLKAIQYYQQNNPKEAIKSAQESLKFAKKTFGKEHPYTATSLNNLAELYRIQKRYYEAENPYKEALAIREKVLGTEHPDYALSLNNLATLYFLEKRVPEAEPLYTKALAIYEKQIKVGKDEKVKANVVNNLDALLGNLGELYKSQSRYPEAEGMFRKLLTIRETSKGKTNPSYAQSLNDLGAIYFLEGKYKEAEPLFANTITILEKSLGKDHPDIAVVLDNIAEVCKKTGDENKAKAYLERANKLRNLKQAQT